MKKLAEEYQFKMKTAGKNPIQRKHIQQEMEKRLALAAQRIAATNSPAGNKMAAKKQIYKLESSLGIGRNLGR